MLPSRKFSFRLSDLCSHHLPSFGKPFFHMFPSWIVTAPFLFLKLVKRLYHPFLKIKNNQWMQFHLLSTNKLTYGPGLLSYFVIFFLFHVSRSVTHPNENFCYFSFQSISLMVISKVSQIFTPSICNLIFAILQN